MIRFWLTLRRSSLIKKTPRPCCERGRWTDRTLHRQCRLIMDVSRQAMRIVIGIRDICLLSLRPRTTPTP